MRRIVFILCLLCATSMMARTATDSLRLPTLSYSGGINVGYIMPDGKVDKTLYDGGPKAYPLSRPVLGAKLMLDIRPGEGSAVSNVLSDWNDATLGVGIDYLNLGNNTWLGSLIAPYTYVTIPIIRLPHFELGIRPGIGLAFSTKTYKTTYAGETLYQYLYKDSNNKTIANQCIGSVTNFYFAEALYMAFPIRDGFAITASAGWYHASNGSTIQPNSGYNMLCAEIGMRYTPDASRQAEERIRSERSDSRFPKALPYYQGKRWDFEASVSGGFRQVYYKDRQTFGVGSISLAAHYRPWAIFKIGGGVDVFFDGAYIQRDTKFGKTNLQLATPADCWRLGISLQPEFVLGDFSVGFHVGAYMLDGVKNLEASNDEEKAALAAGNRLNKPIFYRYDLLNAGSAGHPDGWLYTRILLKYRPTDHFFIQLGMKAHLTKAEFVDAGIGFCL